MGKTRNNFSLEVRARAVRMVLENEGDYSSRWAAITSISNKNGCVTQTLSSWLQRKEVDSGMRAGVPRDAADKMKALEREFESFVKPTISFAKHPRFLTVLSAMQTSPAGQRVGTQPRVQAMTRFIEEHCGVYGPTYILANL